MIISLKRPPSKPTDCHDLWDLLNELEGSEGIIKWDSYCAVNFVDLTKVDTIIGFDNKPERVQHGFINHIAMYYNGKLIYHLLWKNGEWSDDFGNNYIRLK